MTTAIRPQDFATAGNYPAGSDDWSGQPRVVPLSDSEKAEGFTPDTPIGADIRNGLWREEHEARSLLAYRAAQEWDAAALPVLAGGRNVFFNFLVGVSQPAIKQKAIVALGHDINNANRLAYSRSLGSGFFEDSINAPNATIGAYSAAAGAQGEFLTTNHSDMVKHTSLGATETTSGLSSDSVLYYAGWSATPYLAIAGGASLYKGATMGGLTPCTLSGFTLTSGDISALGVAGSRYVDDGSANLVLLTKCTGTGTVTASNVFRVFHSGDGGATWTFALALSAGITSADVCWSDYYACFFLLASDGSMYTSADGGSWTYVRTSASVTASGGCSARYNTLAACGACIAKAFMPSYYGGTFFGVGVVYSFDLGATWRVHHFADSDSFGLNRGLRTILSANNRLWATDGTFVYRSGLLGFEGADY